jgi:hypothetical protein
MGRDHLKGIAIIGRKILKWILKLILKNRIGGHGMDPSGYG